MSLVGVVTLVTSAITGAVVSVVVVVLSSEYSSLSSPQEMMVRLKKKIRIRTNQDNKLFKLFFCKMLKK